MHKDGVDEAPKEVDGALDGCTAWAYGATLGAMVPTVR